MVQVLILNDYVQGEEQRKTIELVLNTAFEKADNVSFTVKECSERINLRAVSPEQVAGEVRALKPEPEIVLIDAHMPDPEDGVRVISALRAAGYGGFTYLWSIADPDSDVKRQPDMFEPPGAGGFRSSDLNGLATAVWESWKSLCGFQVQKREERILRDPLKPALRLLSEVQVGLFGLRDGTVNLVEWREICLRARRWFDQGQSSLCSAVRPFQHRGLDLSQAHYDLEILPTVPSTDIAAIERRVEKLRDNLLKVVAACR